MKVRPTPWGPLKIVPIETQITPTTRYGGQARAIHCALEDTP